MKLSRSFSITVEVYISEKKAIAAVQKSRNGIMSLRILTKLRTSTLVARKRVKIETNLKDWKALTAVRKKS